MKHTILEAFTKKNSLRNLTRFHYGLFDLDLLEISTTVLSLKRIKKSSQKRCKWPKNCLTQKEAEEKIEKRGKKLEMRKSQTKMFFF